MLAGPVYDEVQRCSQLTGIPAPPVLLQEQRTGARARARRRRSGCEIVISAPMTEAPEPVQCWMAAHEFAHIACGHTTQRRWWLDLALGVHMLSTVGFLGWIVMTAPAVTFLQSLTVVAIGSTMMLTQVLVATTQRPRERAADRYAAYVLNRPLTSEIAEWCRRTMPEPRGPHWLRTHPLWADRVEP